MQDNIFIKNRPATFEYAIEDRVKAGIMLTGSEIKSVRLGKVSFNDSYCFFSDGELWLKSLHIAEYVNAGYAGHAPVRDRKLLLKKKEINKWLAKVKEKGFTIVPLRIFFNEKHYAKMEIGIGRGKKEYDKRETIKNRDIDKDIKRILAK